MQETTRPYNPLLETTRLRHGKMFLNCDPVAQVEEHLPHIQELCPHLIGPLLWLCVLWLTVPISHSFLFLVPSQ